MITFEQMDEQSKEDKEENFQTLIAISKLKCSMTRGVEICSLSVDGRNHVTLFSWRTAVSCWKKQNKKQ